MFKFDRGGKREEQDVTQKQVRKLCKKVENVKQNYAKSEMS